MKIQSLILALGVVLAGCSQKPMGFLTISPVHPGQVVANVELASGKGYSLMANKVLGDVLSSVTFKLDGANVPAPVTKTLVKADWTNTNGSYKTIAASFEDVLPGDVTITVTGVGSSKSQDVLSGQQTVSVVSGAITQTTVVAAFLKGDISLGLDPNTTVVQAH